jgi:hypothetical protein
MVIFLLIETISETGDIQCLHKQQHLIFFSLYLRPIFFFIFLSFYGKKIKSMLPSLKIQNGTQIHDGHQNFFIV